MKLWLLAIAIYILEIGVTYVVLYNLFRSYVASRDEKGALRILEILLARGYNVTSDILGEFVKKQCVLPRILEEYKRHIVSLGMLKRNYPKRTVALAVKPSRIGLEINEEIFEKSLNEIISCAAENNVFVWIDAEKLKMRHPTVVRVLSVKEKTNNSNIGMAIQSVHSSSIDLASRLALNGLSLRIVKGAYRDGNLKEKNEIRDCFLRIFHRARILGAKEATLAAGTHDDKLIEELLLSQETRLEVQMLYGVRMRLQEELLEKGVRMHIYVPWGTYRNAVGFLLRRVREGITLSAIFLFIWNIFESRKMQKKWRLHN